MAIRNYKLQPLSGFLGGVDYDSTPFNVPEDCLIDASNIIPSTSVGGISQRMGITKFNSVAITESAVAKSIVGLFSFVVAGVEYFLSQAGTKFYNNTPEGTWSDITGSLTLTDTANNLTSADILNSVALFANRSRDAMWKWPLSGNGVAITPPPSGAGTIVKSFNRRFFVGGNAATPLIVDFGDIDAATFTANNNLNFDEGQGDAVTGIINRGTGALMVGKQKSLHFVEPTGSTPPFTKYLFMDGVGIVSQQSIVTLPGGAIMWWDTDDIYMMVGNQVDSATNHPTKGTPRLRNFFRNKVNQSRLQYVVGTYYPALDIVRWHYAPVGSSNNTACLDYHVKTKSFWPGTVRGTSIASRTIAGQSRIYSGDTDGFVRRGDNGTNDDGGQIASNARIPWQFFEAISIRKKLYKLLAYLELGGNYSVQADFYFDQSSTPSITNVNLTSSALPSSPLFDVADWDVDSFPVESTLFESSGDVNRLFKTVSVNLHHTGADEPFTIDGIAFLERPLEINLAT